ncbi:3'(2'),5'-bisphosphate nucleotidase CysQ [Ponticaulis sp.]|uniref:3'(2'),5'-bisphosphate nucleotidase CysQ n=1 Tax=Ponticaulis sp. TaxID=2020902 RepID=UPI000B627EA9|nr:3'(2'),5'-bisphosphate nucleotidase CysQ [Ponticaulis sp.]MAI88912.1 3'(2'),5'-bisphosphate nucleotidase CysQ [Ponticaulis sp.]OUY01602.1 MAG: hypothetical protein CBB65_00335 [Hyphomonadaceae bacterium TMED5]
MPDADLQADLNLLRDAALEAGSIAMTYFRTELKVWDKEPDHPVSEADLAVNDHLEKKLRGARPDYGWLSEETADTPDRLMRDRVFVVDPIDGTRAFLQGQPHFCIALAVLEYGQTVAAAIYAPVFNEMFLAAAGQGATLNGEPILASLKTSLDKARIIADRRVFEPEHWPDPWPDLVFPDVTPNATAYRMALVADGRWDAVVVLRNKFDWDVAAAALIIAEAGGAVSCHIGDEFLFNQKVALQRSLIAGGPVIHEQIVARMNHLVLPEPGDS